MKKVKRKLSIDIRNLRAENAGLRSKVEYLESVIKQRELSCENLIKKNKQFKQNLISLIMEN